MNSWRSNGNRVGSEPEAHAWENLGGLESKDSGQHAAGSTYPESDASLSASIPEEEHHDIRHFSSPLATYQTSLRNERSGHIGFAPDIGPRRAPQRADPSPNDINPSTLHPSFCIISIGRSYV